MKHNLFVRFFAVVLLCLLLSSCTTGSGTGSTAPISASPATDTPTAASGQTEAPDQTQDVPSETGTADREGTSEPMETGTAAPESTDAPQQTTSAPATAAPVTTSAIQTTGFPAVTTKAPEITTKTPEITTKAPEITTKAPEITTKAPEITTQAPEITTRTPETTAAPFDPKNPVFPEADYHGESFTVYARAATTYNHVGIFADEENGDYLNDITYIRNKALEKLYNVRISLMEAASPSRSLKADDASGLVNYDVLLDQRSSLSSPVLEGLLGDWNSLGIRTEAPWWDANCARGYNIDGKLYMAANDVSISNFIGARFVYFNPALAEKYHLENPYDLVDRNRWTLEKFTEMSKAVMHPSEDGGIGEYGILRETGSLNGTHMHLLTGFGLSYVKWEDGGLQIVPDQDDISLMQKMGDQLKKVLNSDCTLTYDEIAKLDDTFKYTSKWDTGRAYFARGHFLFMEGTASISDILNQMEGTFGVLPNPKYTSDQQSYCHKVDKYSLIWAFPASSRIDRQKLATVMDCWAFCSSQTVMVYYLRSRIISSEEENEKAFRNLTLVKNSIAYELGDLFSIGVDSEINNGYESNNLRYFFPSKALLAKLNSVSQQLARLE